MLGLTCRCRMNIELHHTVSQVLLEDRQRPADCSKSLRASPFVRRGRSFRQCGLSPTAQSSMPRSLGSPAGKALPGPLAIILRTKTKRAQIVAREARYSRANSRLSSAQEIESVTGQRDPRRRPVMNRLQGCRPLNRAPRRCLAWDATSLLWGRGPRGHAGYGPCA